jgi:hypothetical protein
VVWRTKDARPIKPEMAQEGTSRKGNLNTCHSTKEQIMVEEGREGEVLFDFEYSAGPTLTGATAQLQG